MKHISHFTNRVMNTLLIKKSEDAEMCRKEICQRMITKIEIDIVEIHEEIKYENNDARRMQLRSSIANAEEIITDLKQMEAGS